MFSTLRADGPMFCWPLDHVFHDSAFKLVRLQRLPSIECDRSPVLAALQLVPAATADRAAPEPDRDDLEDRERIAEGQVAK